MQYIYRRELYAALALLALTGLMVFVTVRSAPTAQQNERDKSTLHDGARFP